MNKELTIKSNVIEQIVVDGDLKSLDSEQRIQYYRSMCKTFNLDPLTKPFEFIELNKKLVLYVTKNACDQLRRTHGISITKLIKYREGDAYFVEAHAQDREGRIDVSTAAIMLVTEDKFYYDKITKERVLYQKGGDLLVGVDLINAFLKAESKAKRRVTLSMGGLGLPDPDDIEMMAQESTQLANTEEVAHAIVEESQARKNSYIIDESFLTGMDVGTMVTNKINSIEKLAQLQEYLEWKQANKEGLKAFCKDNPEICMGFGELIQAKQREIQDSE